MNAYVKNYFLKCSAILHKNTQRGAQTTTFMPLSGTVVGYVRSLANA
jgi:hypothetical protein